MKLFKYMLFSLLLFSQVAAAFPAIIGTGWFASSDGVIITNAHVVAKTDLNKPIYVRVNGMDYEATVIGLDGRYDVAVLKIYAKSHTCLPLTNTKVQVGNTLTGVLIKIGQFTSVSEFESAPIQNLATSVLSIRNSFYIPGLPFLYRGSFEVNGIGVHGNSGSPIVDSNNRVIGMLFGKQYDSNFILPTSDILDTFRSSNIRVVCDNPSSKLTDTIVVVYGHAQGTKND